MEDSTGHDTRGQAEKAFGSDEKPGLFARLRGRRSTGESPTTQSGPTTSVSGIPAQIKPAAHAQTQVEARAAAEAKTRAQRTPPTSRPPALPSPAMRTASSGTSIDVGRLVRVLVILGIVVWVGVTIVNAVSTTVHKIKIPSFPGITVPSTPGFSPSPTAPFDNFGSNDFARVLQGARAKAGGGASVITIRVEPDRATFIVRGDQGQKVITISGDATQVFTSGGAAIPGGISLSRVQGSAPHRIIARLKSRFGVPPTDVEYLAAIGNSALGGIAWSAHLRSGETYTADGTGRNVKRPPG